MNISYCLSEWYPYKLWNGNWYYLHTNDLKIKFIVQVEKGADFLSLVQLISLEQSNKNISCSYYYQKYLFKIISCILLTEGLYLGKYQFPYYITVTLKKEFKWFQKF